MVNHLIRETGLYPYLEKEYSDWQEQFVYEAFKVNTGEKEPLTLHREQSLLLRKLLEGKSIAVSAPTSFGKSFVIDAFIAIKKPKNVVIIVPTIALTDETRKRIYKKFSKEYRIITTPDVQLADKNIFIFPQERAIGYIKKIDSIDILIIDEFYKAGKDFDKERSHILLKAILDLGQKTTQKYFLAPNIADIEDVETNPITKGMEFLPLDFNTVCTETENNYEEPTSSNEDFKEKKLIEILQRKATKSLIYAGTFTNIDDISNVLNQSLSEKNIMLLNNFSNWLKINYYPDFILADLVKKGVGIHNGKLHRSLSQIQVKLFEDPNGLDSIISTSSIIEGVNTFAENVVIWANKNGRPNLKDFTYKNIIGRGGRMFKHFIGKIFLLEKPPAEETIQLNLGLSDDLLNSLDRSKYTKELTKEQLAKIIVFNEEIDNLIGQGVYSQGVKDNAIQTSPSTLKNIASDIHKNPGHWNGLISLNSKNPNDWDRILFSILNLTGSVGASYTDLVAYVKAMSKNWSKSIPELMSMLRSNGVTIEKFFEHERTVTFKIASIISDVSFVCNHILHKNVDVSPFIAKISHAFLPRLVYELEEYSLPRMVSKKIQDTGLINLETTALPIYDAITQFNEIGKDNLIRQIKNLHPFENYILDYFYDGISEQN